MDTLQFTPRQQEVVAEMCKGKSNKEIAKELGMAEATVKLHLTEVFRHLNVGSRYQAIIKLQVVPETTEAAQPTDKEILAHFTNTAFDTLNESWSDRVLKFGRALLSRDKPNLKERNTQ